MRKVIIDNEGHLEALLDACAKGGHSSVVAISNAGLGIGRVRVTILPNTALTAPLDYSDKQAWIDAFRDAIGLSKKEDGRT